VLAALALALVAALPAAAQIAVRAETVYPGTGEPIKDGVVLVKNGKIERVGRAADVRIPEGYRVLQAKVVTPGLIDARTVVGLAGQYNQRHDQDQLERSTAIQPELRAIDAYNPRERLVSYLRGFGVTTLHTGHGPGTLVSGQTMVVKTTGTGAESSVLVPSAMIAVTLGPEGLEGGGKSPGTRSKAVALLRAELLRAKEAEAKRAAADEKTPPPTRDLRAEAFARVIRGEMPLLVRVDRAQDILTTLRVAREFNIRIVLDGAAEAYLVVEQIRASGFPVIVHPTMSRTGGEAENLSMETAGTLRKAGIPMALQSGFEGYVPKTRVVLFEAAVAAANGLELAHALASITIDAARLLGVSDRIGSLEPGKDADLALFDGDPFEYTTHVTAVILDGQLVSDTPR
jgi:imidazolonepropionase-like amidohydrolase